jgi:membrane protein
MPGGSPRGAGRDRDGRGVLRNLVRILRNTIRAFLDDECMRMAAALSFYAVFSLPPLLGSFMLLLGSILEPAEARALLLEHAYAVLGPAGAQQAEALLREAPALELSGPAAAFGIGAFVFAATAAFAQLQRALNTAWGVRPDPARSGIGVLLIKRAISFVMILGLGAALLLAAVASAVLGGFGAMLDRVGPGLPSRALLEAANLVLFLAVLTGLFTLMLNYLPDAVVAWRDALIGGLFTAVLFTVGRIGLGMYFARSDPGSAFGAAGSLAATLLWIYYSAMIVLLGAEFTQAWARARGAPIVPKQGAVRVVRRVDGE